MKRRKLFLIVPAVLIIAMLTGCSVNIPFLNKDDEQTGEPAPGDDQVGDDGSTRAQIVDGLSFYVGDTVVVGDLVTIDVMHSDNVIQSVIMQDDGTIADSYTFQQEGSYALTVLVEFLDGVVFNGQANVEVSTPELALPDNIVNNLATKSWSIGEFESVAGADYLGVTAGVSGVKASYVNDMVAISGVGQLYGLESSPASLPINAKAVVIEQQAIAVLNAVGMSQFTTDISMALSVNGIQAILSIDGEPTEEDIANVTNPLGWYKQWYSSIVTASSVPTDVIIYDTDGREYPVNVVQYTMDLTSLGGSSMTYAGPAYIEYNGSRILFDLSNAVSITVPMPWMEDGSDVAVPASYDELVQLLPTIMTDEAKQALTNGRPSVNDVTANMRSLSDNLMLGDVTHLLPTQEPGSEVVEDPGAEEIPEEEGVVADVHKSYAQQHPEIYTWPEDQTKYRRWVYLIDKTTQFVSTIINPDGTHTISGLTEEDDWRIDTGTGEGSNPPTVPPVVTGESYELTSNYATYLFSESQMDGVKFDKDNSTGGRLVLTYNGKKYYVETVRTSQIQNYVSSCLYNTDGFANGSFQVVEHSGDAQGTSIGKIIEYTIRYSDSTGTARENPYMAVYNIYNDYLCIYGEQLPTDEHVMRDIIWNCVTLKN